MGKRRSADIKIHNIGFEYLYLTLMAIASIACLKPRFYTFVAALKGSGPWTQIRNPVQKVSYRALYCRTCKQKVFTTTVFRSFSQSSKRGAKTVQKERQYPSKLLIYESGDIRVTWVSFWKSVALLQFGTTLVFGAPVLWNNPNQPNPSLRKFQAFIVGVLGTIPTLTLAYVTAPFVHKVFLQIPEYARRSRQDLMHFVRTLRVDQAGTANTKLEFETLRTFPFRKTTATFLHELRALPPKKMRLANIELIKTEEWAKRQRQKGYFRRIFEMMNEPRFKFYVKEGRFYTMKTKVPGVWEQVSQRIQEQSVFGKEESGIAKHGARRAAVLRKPVRPVMANNAPDVLKRQTSRPTQR